VLHDNIFKHNLELENIGFAFNKIQAINPRFFSHLYKLKFVNFLKNDCIDRDFINQNELIAGLRLCFKNCMKDQSCANKSGEIVDQTETNEAIEKEGIVLNCLFVNTNFVVIDPLKTCVVEADLG
jgi:hypothetical protein